MSPELARYLVLPLISKHPLPWRVDHDWTAEVLDAKGQLVIQLMTDAHALELIEFATELSASDAQGAVEVKKLLVEAGIED